MKRRQFIAGLAATATALVADRGDAMEGLEKTKVLFIAGFRPIVRDVAASHKLYGGILDISFKEEAGNYLHIEALQGAKSFALWPLAHAAQSCFGSESLAWGLTPAAGLAGIFCGGRRGRDGANLG